MTATVEFRALEHPRAEDGKFTAKAIEETAGGLRALSFPAGDCDWCGRESDVLTGALCDRCDVAEQIAADSLHIGQAADTKGTDLIASELAKSAPGADPKTTLASIASTIFGTGRPDPCRDTVSAEAATERLARWRRTRSANELTPDSAALDSIYMLLATRSDRGYAQEAVVRGYVRGTGRPGPDTAAGYEARLASWRVTQGYDEHQAVA